MAGEAFRGDRPGTGRASLGWGRGRCSFCKVPGGHSRGSASGGAWGAIAAPRGTARPSLGLSIPSGGGRGQASPAGEGTHRRAAGGRFSLGSSGLLLGWPWLGAGVLAGRKRREHTSTCRGRPGGDPASSGPLPMSQGPTGIFTAAITEPAGPGCGEHRTGVQVPDLGPGVRLVVAFAGCAAASLRASHLRSQLVSPGKALQAAGAACKRLEVGRDWPEPRRSQRAGGEPGPPVPGAGLWPGQRRPAELCCWRRLRGGRETGREGRAPRWARGRERGACRLTRGSG